MNHEKDVSLLLIVFSDFLSKQGNKKLKDQELRKYYDVGSATWAELRRAPLQSAMEPTNLGHGHS